MSYLGPSTELQKSMKLSADMQEELDNAVRNALNAIFAGKPFVKVQVIQKLWSGYGEIARYSSTLCNQESVIVKVVDARSRQHHPRGWNTAISHQRKLSSYRNEQHFYRNHARATNAQCRVPVCLAQSDIETDNWLIMEDLDRSGFNARCEQANGEVIRLGLSWLAHFHALHFQTPATNLWPVGTYWHLATRPDEWHAMPESELKCRAKDIDQRLNSARFQTLVHGDAKLANFCFSSDFDSSAAVDFQYVGRGAGIKDVIYFLGSCLDEQALFQQADGLVDFYFNTLKRALRRYHSTADSASLEQEWRNLLPVAWADFERFLLGWAPDHFKRNGYSAQQTEQALALI